MTMIKSDLRGKKLLLIGGLNTTADLIKLAHRNGVKIGVADYNKNTYVKGLADYAHDISVVDENSVIELFKRENYDGIITPAYIVIRVKDGLSADYAMFLFKSIDNKKIFNGWVLGFV